MTLRDLTAGLHKPVIAGSLETEIASLTYDSRKAGKDSLFAALRGANVDGHDFIDKAIAAGAAAILAETAPPDDCKVPWIHVSNSRQALAIIAATFYHQPASSLAIGGVTGTNGKTTIAFLTQHILNKALLRCGLIGTVYYDLGSGEQIAATHTTPESLDLQQHLSAMCDNGCRSAMMEVSSHALHQDRVYGIPFRAAVFTNLTQDHLDYHETMEKYFEAKTILFEMVAAQKTGSLIVNIDDLWGKKLAIKFDGTNRITTYGMGALADFRASNLRYDLTGTTFELTTKGRQFLVRSPLIGDFNVYNTLAAICAANAMGANLREAINSVKDVPQVPGRLERVSDEKSVFHTFVDYAHTPDAIVNALRSLRMLRPRRIITVFGCGGDRDRLKRPLMARAAEEGSDICILTSDNPRFEDPAQIIADTRKGFGKKSYVEIIDRAEAIRVAISNAEAGDIVFIAGKGHETYQDIKGTKHNFDDRRVAHGSMLARRKAAAEKIQIKMQNREAWERENAAAREAPPVEEFDSEGRRLRKWNQ